MNRVVEGPSARRRTGGYGLGLGLDYDHPNELTLEAVIHDTATTNHCGDHSSQCL